MAIVYDTEALVSPERGSVPGYAAACGSAELLAMSEELADQTRPCYFSTWSAGQHVPFLARFAQASRAIHYAARPPTPRCHRAAPPGGDLPNTPECRPLDADPGSAGAQNHVE